MRKIVKQWLNTDPFDIELEDRQNEVLQSLGLDLYGPSYDRDMSRLDKVYRKINKLGEYSDV